MRKGKICLDNNDSSCFLKSGGVYFFKCDNAMNDCMKQIANNDKMKI